MHAPSRFANVYFAPAIHKESYTQFHLDLFRGTASLGRTKRDLSVVSDLKTDRTPYCCNDEVVQITTCNHLIYGRTAVGLIAETKPT